MFVQPEDNRGAAGFKFVLWLVPTLFLVVLAFGVTSAHANVPAWSVRSYATPASLPRGGTGEIDVIASNLGAVNANAAVAPILISDTLPSDIEATSIAVTGGGECDLASLSCEVTSGELLPYEYKEMRIHVSVKPSASLPAVNLATVSGGGAKALSSSDTVRFGSAPVSFGVQSLETVALNEDGTPATQAGAHPFQYTTTFQLNERSYARLSATVKDLRFQLPPGLIGNATVIPQCTTAQFATFLRNPVAATNQCPDNTAIGVASVRLPIGEVGHEEFLTQLLTTVPIFNMVPAAGEPARFAFDVQGAPVFLDTSVRSGSDYGVTVSSNNTSNVLDVAGVQTTLWGVPSDPAHDRARGWACVAGGFYRFFGNAGLCPEPSLNGVLGPALLTLPTSCTGPLTATVEATSWAEPDRFTEPVEYSSHDSAGPYGLDGCNRLPFAPTISVAPTSDAATSPSGLDFNIDFHDQGLTNAEGVAQSQLRDTTVTLPEGLTINPSAGVGLGGCTVADYERETLESVPGTGCPNDSTLGSVEIETPLLSQKLEGSVFIAQPYENPFKSLVALYVVAKNPETGVLIKLAGKVTPNPVTGQLTTTFENNPQLPFEHFNFHFREGQQAPLITPPTCGTYTAQAQLTPWSDPVAPLTETSSFEITKGFDGGACPSGGVPPFAPQIISGTLNNNAGAFSPFYLRLSRNDGESEITSFSTVLPPGLTGILSGIPYCPEQDIALARGKSGAQEEAEPACPQASLLGHSLVGTGVGAVLAYTPGKIYLAGPYNDDPFSLVSVTSAVVGPFDLGTVVIRLGLKIDPHTAQVGIDPSASEPIPRIIDGIVIHVRDIRVTIDRQNFTLNPTSCNRMTVSSTVGSAQGQSATVSSPFQAASCTALKFAPTFFASTSGKTSRANGASLSVKLAYPKAPVGSQANIARVKVNLPKQLPSRLTTLQKACTAVQFNSNPAGCPAASVVGHAVVHTPLIPVPLTGPAIFVSHGGEDFPSLTMVLQGDGITIDLVGDTHISNGVTSTTFKTVPDTPFSTFELTLPAGKFSALGANTNLCKAASKLRMPTEFVAQNGAQIHQSTRMMVTGCPNAHKARKKEKKKNGRKRKK
jgi:hypothetical protein